MATLKEIAKLSGVPLEVARNVLRETPGYVVTKAVQDNVFGTARQLGYDLKKLKIGKRMQFRKDTFKEIIKQLEDHPNWNRKDIVSYLTNSVEMVDRVHKRVFKEEFPEAKTR